MNGWLAVAAVVVVVDLNACRTGAPLLSTDFRRASRTHPLLVGFATSYLLAHLFGALPSIADPLAQLGRLSR